MVMAKYCIGCGEQIHPKRVEILPNTKTCVGCSTTGAKRGIPVMHGNVEKDDTWVDMVFMEADEYEAYERAMGRLKHVNNNKTPEFQDYDSDEDSTTNNVSFDEIEE
jgi:hypothetical protein